MDVSIDVIDDLYLYDWGGLLRATHTRGVQPGRVGARQMGRAGDAPTAAGSRDTKAAKSDAVRGKSPSPRRIRRLLSATEAGHPGRRHGGTAAAQRRKGGISQNAPSLPASPTSGAPPARRSSDPCPRRFPSARDRGPRDRSRPRHRRDPRFAAGQPAQAPRVPRPTRLDRT